MCGIVGYSGKRSAQEVLLNGLEKLEYRGYDSAGVALALEGGIHVVKSKGRLEVLRRKLEAESLPESFCGIGHTRWATHGEPSDVNSHPHSTPRVSIVHNGIIENYGPLKADLMAKGVTFESETDTEVLVKLIDYFCCTQPKASPLTALREALGDGARQLCAGRAVPGPNRTPSTPSRRRAPSSWAGARARTSWPPTSRPCSSTPAATASSRRATWRWSRPMASGSTTPLASRWSGKCLTADWDEEAAEKGGYPHFMLKEIHEQPAAITGHRQPPCGGRYARPPHSGADR